MKRILLVADASPEIGWGHAMRTLAVAQELDGLASVRWVSSIPKAIRGLDPPCPVVAQKSNASSSSAVLIDGVFRDDTNEPINVWTMVDHGVGDGKYNRICPHFGAESRDWGSGMVATGPRWMPLRWEVLCCDEAYNGGGKVLTYRAGVSPTNEGVCLDGYAAAFPWWEHGPYKYAIVPPSTIAYECMALGIPVLLADPPEGQSREIGEAMVGAGVAYWYDEHTGPDRNPAVFVPMAKRARELVDGRGAERVANLLMEG